MYCSRILTVHRFHLFKLQIHSNRLNNSRNSVDMKLSKRIFLDRIHLVSDLFSSPRKIIFGNSSFNRPNYATNGNYVAVLTGLWAAATPVSGMGWIFKSDESPNGRTAAGGKVTQI